MVFCLKYSLYNINQIIFSLFKYHSVVHMLMKGPSPSYNALLESNILECSQCSYDIYLICSLNISQEDNICLPQ